MDYDISIFYHLGKANVVTDSLSRKMISTGGLAFIAVSVRSLDLDIHFLANMKI